MASKSHVAAIGVSILLTSCVSNTEVNLGQVEESSPGQGSAEETPTVKPPPGRTAEPISQFYDRPGLIERLETCELDQKRYAAFIELAREQYRPGRVVLKFSEALTDEQHLAFDNADVVFEEYLGDEAYIFTLPASAVDTIPSQNLECAEFLKPYDKATPRVLDYRRYEWAYIPSVDSIRVVVSGFQDSSSESLISAVREVRGEITGPSPFDGVVQAIIPVNGIATLGANYHVRDVDLGPNPLLPLNNTARGIVETDFVQRAFINNGPPTYSGLVGDDVKVGIFDTGVDEKHEDFMDTAAGDRFYKTNASRPSSACPVGNNNKCDHGTHVASIATGNGRSSSAAGFPAFSLRGHAPEAKIGDYTPVPELPQANWLPEYGKAIVTDGTDVLNHSWVQSGSGSYDKFAAVVDRVLFGDAPYQTGSVTRKPQVWAAGNNGRTTQYGLSEGYYAVFTSAKNSISVGGIDSLNGRLYAETSLGPTHDGRIKPDIVAPGCRDSIGPPWQGIWAAKNKQSKNYRVMCGTSMAAPVVTGVTALLIEQHRNNGVQLLYPSTYKAVLINTSKDLVKPQEYASGEFNNPDTLKPVTYHVGPDFATGYGLVQAEQARRLIADIDRYKQKIFRKKADKHEICVNVLKGDSDFKVTLAWDDYPFTAKSDISKKSTLVNDLDLSVVAPDGQTYLPWTLDPLPTTVPKLKAGDRDDQITTATVKPAYRGVDRRNNVEQITKHRPAKGVWRIQVSPHALRKRPQTYSLAFSHKQVACPAVGGGGGNVFGNPNTLDDYTIALRNDPWSGSDEGRPAVNRKAVYEVYNGENLRRYLLCVVPDGDAATNEIVRVTYNTTGNRTDNQTVVIRETGAPRCVRRDARYINLYMPGTGDANVRVRRIYP